MAKKKEELQEEIEELEEVEEYDDYDEDEDDEEYEEDNSYEEVLRIAKEERKQMKEEAMKDAFKRDESVGIRKNYNFLIGYGTFLKIVSFVGAGILALLYVILAIVVKDATYLIAAAVVSFALVLSGYLSEALLKWLAYVLKCLHEINQKLK